MSSTWSNVPLHQQCYVGGPHGVSARVYMCGMCGMCGTHMCGTCVYVWHVWHMCGTCGTHMCGMVTGGTRTQKA